MSMCKCVEKFSPFEQSKVKIEIGKIVNQIELERYEQICNDSADMLRAVNTELAPTDGETLSIEKLPFIVC